MRVSLLLYHVTIKLITYINWSIIVENKWGHEFKKKTMQPPSYLYGQIHFPLLKNSATRLGVSGRSISLLITTGYLPHFIHSSLY